MHLLSSYHHQPCFPRAEVINTYNHEEHEEGPLRWGLAPTHGKGRPGCLPATHSCTHSAFVRLLACVSPHMHYQHILGFEGFLFPGAVKPPAHKLLFLSMNMVIIDMLGLGKREKKEMHYSFLKATEEKCKICSILSPKGDMKNLTKL